MKAHKVEEVRFGVNQQYEDMNIKLIWKEGGLYISISGIILNDGEKWYELPVGNLEDISIIEEDPITILFKSEALRVVITGKNAEKLSALRHFLLPYIHGTPTNEWRTLKSLLKIMSLGIQDIKTLSELLHVNEAEINNLINQARAEGIMDTNGELTAKGREMFSPEEKPLIEE